MIYHSFDIQTLFLFHLVQNIKIYLKNTQIYDQNDW